MNDQKSQDMTLAQIKQKYQSQVDEVLIRLRDGLHQELFPEEYEDRNDSSSDADRRERGINPMSESYIKNAKERRELLGVSPLKSNGMPEDYSSEIYVQKLLSEFTKNSFALTENVGSKKKGNISDFFKRTSGNHPK